jgi:hypothetical protein
MRVPAFHLLSLIPLGPQELKVDGVSQYLHIVNSTHLLGLGMAGDSSGRLAGLQLSLFDVTDVTRPQLASSVTFGSTFASSLANNDHKAIRPLTEESDRLIAESVRARRLALVSRRLYSSPPSVFQRFQYSLFLFFTSEARPGRPSSSTPAPASSWSPCRTGATPVCPVPPCLTPDPPPHT